MSLSVNDYQLSITTQAVTAPPCVAAGGPAGLSPDLLCTEAGLGLSALPQVHVPGTTLQSLLATFANEPRVLAGLQAFGMRTQQFGQLPVGQLPGSRVMSCDPLSASPNATLFSVHEQLGFGEATIFQPSSIGCIPQPIFCPLFTETVAYRVWVSDPHLTRRSYYDKVWLDVWPGFDNVDAPTLTAYWKYTCDMDAYGRTYFDILPGHLKVIAQRDGYAVPASYAVPGVPYSAWAAFPINMRVTFADSAPSPWQTWLCLDIVPDPILENCEPCFSREDAVSCLTRNL